MGVKARNMCWQKWLFVQLQYHPLERPLRFLPTNTITGQLRSTNRPQIVVWAVSCLGWHKIQLINFFACLQAICELIMTKMVRKPYPPARIWKISPPQGWFLGWPLNLSSWISEKQNITPDFTTMFYNRASGDNSPHQPVFHMPMFINGGTVSYQVTCVSHGFLKNTFPILQIR